MMRRRVPRAVGCRAAAAYVRLLRRTGRWHIEGESIPRGLVARGQPFLVAFWHGRMLMVSQGWRFAAPFKMVISQHPDGRLIASTIAHHGFAALLGNGQNRLTTHSIVLQQYLRTLLYRYYVL